MADVEIVLEQMHIMHIKYLDFESIKQRKLEKFKVALDRSLAAIEGTAESGSTLN